MRGKQTQILGGQQRGNGVQKLYQWQCSLLLSIEKKISNQFIFNARIKTVHGLMKTL